MLTQLPKKARDVLANAVHDGGIARLLELAILRLLEIGEVFAVTSELAVPFYGGVIHSRWKYVHRFLLSGQAYTRFSTESKNCFQVDTENIKATGLRQGTMAIGVRQGESAQIFLIGLADAPAIERSWLCDVPVLALPRLVERLLRHGFKFKMAAVVTLIRAQSLDESFTEQLNSAFHAAYLDCLNEVRQEAAYERG